MGGGGEWRGERRERERKSESEGEGTEREGKERGRRGETRSNCQVGGVNWVTFDPRTN